jgi:serine/threonine-protein kinase RsbW
MADPTWLIRLHPGVADEFVATLGDQKEDLEFLDSPAAFFEKLDNIKTPMAVVVVERAEDLDPLWFREVRRRSDVAQVLVVARSCSESTWRRLVLSGAVGVECPPWNVDLEAELYSEPVLSNLFRRHAGVRPHGKTMFRYTLPSDTDYVVGIVHIVSLMALEFGFPSLDTMMNLPLAVDEALTNAIVHGNQRDPNKRVEIEGQVDDAMLRLKITDEGRGFRREEAANPLDPERLLATGGRGLFLIESVMDEVRWTQEGRCIEMIKRRAR